MILLTLKPDVRPGDTETVAARIERATGLRARPDPLKPVRRVLVEEDPEDVEAFADSVRREFPEVSRIIDVKRTRTAKRYDLDDVKEDVARVISEIEFPGETFAVEARRLDKDLPFTSKEVEVEVGDVVRRLTGAGVDLDNPDVVVDVHLSERGYLIGVTPRTVREPERDWLPHDAFSHVYVCFERPRTVYEIADMVRIVAALRLGGLSLVNPEERALREALNKVGASSTVRVETFEDVEDAVRGTVVALHPTAPESEETLANVAGKAEELTLLVGSETEGLSPRARRTADVEVHLGPTSAEPMRSSNAVAYALGVISHLVR